MPAAMPFTPAHPALILPLCKHKRFSQTALIAGSMVPDFEFFFQLREVENIGHHTYGILLFDFPVAMILCFLFHNVVRNLLIRNLPSAFRSRFVSTLSFDWNKYASTNKVTISISLLTGIASHLLWDAFTHYDGWFVMHIPALAKMVSLVQITLPVYFLLQLGFSVMGLGLIGAHLFCLPESRLEKASKTNAFYWPLFATVFGVMLCLRLLGWPQYNNFWSVFIAVMGCIFYSCIIVSLAITNFFKIEKSRNYVH